VGGRKTEKKGERKGERELVDMSENANGKEGVNAPWRKTEGGSKVSKGKMGQESTKGGEGDPSNYFCPRGGDKAWKTG